VFHKSIQFLTTLHENLPLEEPKWKDGWRGGVEFVSDEMKI
jgi:hypothetical protein